MKINWRRRKQSNIKYLISIRPILRNLDPFHQQAASNLAVRICTQITTCLTPQDLQLQGVRLVELANHAT